MTYFPVVEKYKGLGVFDYQSRERIEMTVRPQIDMIDQIDDVAILYDFAVNAMLCPEARLFARAKIEAVYELRATEHGNRGDTDLTKLRVGCPTGGLLTMKWADPMRYCSLLDGGDVYAPIGLRRDVPRRPPAEAERLSALAATGHDLPARSIEHLGETLDEHYKRGRAAG